MLTSKEMQLKILDKMRENVENDLALMNSIQYRNRVNLLWDDRVHVIITNQFTKLEMRVKPETITINGVEIPKPLSREKVAGLAGEKMLYIVSDNHKSFNTLNTGNALAFGNRFVYETKEEAIEASRLLFGIEG